MDYSAAQVARELHTSIPRVKRALRRLRLDATQSSGGRVRLSATHVERLRAELGTLPCLGSLSRSQTQALAALARAPLGIVSVPALARRAGLSTTACSHAVVKLERAGLIERREETVAAGHAHRASVLHVKRTHPRYRALARELAAVTTPIPERPADPQDGVPYRLHHLFWNADAYSLNVREHDAYIAGRLLSAGNLDGLAWGAEHLSPEAWARASAARRLEPRMRALATNLATSGQTKHAAA